MKHFLNLLLCLIAYLPISSVPQAVLHKGCDELYAEDCSNILTQFHGVATPEQLKEYKQFMLAIKLRNDMLFKLTPFERSIQSEDRALLRSPLTNYTACRSSVGVAFGYDFQTINPPPGILSPCEKTYAVQMQQILNSLRRTVSARTLAQYEDFMLFLKEYEDYGFVVSEFERKTRYATRARLREPLVKYLTCRNSLLRLLEQSKSQ